MSRLPITVVKKDVNDRQKISSANKKPPRITRDGVVKLARVDQIRSSLKGFAAAAALFRVRFQDHQPERETKLRLWQIL